MTRTEYYRKVKETAREQRALFNLNTYSVTLTDMRKMYKEHSLSIMLWPPPGIEAAKTKTLKGAYRHIEGEPTVLISRNKPKDLRVVTMAHELKHHLMDFDLVAAGASACKITPENNFIEKGAELFAVELIFPEEEFKQQMASRNIELGSCTPEDIVRLKHETETTLSHGSLAKRALFLGYALPDTLNGIQWFKLNETMYGEPVYKRIQRYRKARLSAF